MQKKGSKVKSLVGRRFGKLTAVSYTGRNEGGSAVWRCRCDCGNEVEVTRKSLLGRSGRRSCGCLSAGRPSLNLEGLRFGMLTAVELLEQRERGSAVWRCVCDCGNEVEVRAGRLVSGKKRHCGCSSKQGVYRDLTGMRFGMLTAIEPCGKADRGYLWRCVCDCGNEKAVRSSNLTSGRTRSCGCASKRGRPSGTPKTCTGDPERPS